MLTFGSKWTGILMLHVLFFFFVCVLSRVLLVHVETQEHLDHLGPRWVAFFQWGRHNLVPECRKGYKTMCRMHTESERADRSCEWYVPKDIPTSCTRTPADYVTVAPCRTGSAYWNWPTRWLTSHAQLQAGVGLLTRLKFENKFRIGKILSTNYTLST